jgi:hypothetical protein
MLRMTEPGRRQKVFSVPQGFDAIECLVVENFPPLSPDDFRKGGSANRL